MRFICVGVYVYVAISVVYSVWAFFGRAYGVVCVVVMAGML